MPHKSKLEESVALHQKRLKEAFAMARQLTSEEAARQQRHYDCRAGAITLQPGDVVMVCTDRFVGKRKVKDRWEEGGYVIVNQLEDWPVYKVKCSPSENKRKAKYLTLHCNRLMLVPPGDDMPQDPTQLKVAVAIVLNANIGTILYDGESDYSDCGTSLPSLLTRQGVDKIPHVWLNGEFRTQLFTQVESEAIQSPQNLVENDVSDPEWFLLSQMMRRHSLEDMRRVDLIEGKMLLSVTIGWDSFSSFSPISTQMSPLVRHAMGGKPVTGCLCWLGGSDTSHLREEPLIL